MRDIASALYSSPSPSMASREPVDPDGIDDLMRLEPTGVHSESVHSESPRPPSRHQKMEKIKQLDVARLVGVPPPPPKTPPPKKSRRASSRSSSSVNRGGGSTVSSLASEESELFGTFSTPSLLSTDSVEPSLDAPLDETPENRSPEKEEAKPTQAAPATIDVEKTRSVAEERRLAALAMYQSKDLVLDHEENLLAQELLRPAMATLENTPDRATNRDTDPSGPSTEKIPASPVSEVTEIHSNQTQEENEVPPMKPDAPLEPIPQGELPPTPNSSSRSGPVDLDDEPTLVSVSSGIENQYNGQTPERKKTERRRRGLSIERILKSDSNNSGSQEKPKKDQKKRGFFKKLFRGRSKDKERSTSEEADVDTSRHAVDPSEPRGASPSKKSVASSPASSKPTAKQATPKHEATQVETVLSPTGISFKGQDLIDVQKDDEPAQVVQRVVLKPALKSPSQRQYQGSPMNLTPASPSTTIDDSNRTPTTQSVEVAELGAVPEHHQVNGGAVSGQSIQSAQSSEIFAELESMPSEMSYSSSRMPRAFSQDPPDDEHGDPPIRTGPPLLSPTSMNHHQLGITTSEEEDELNRIESVRSRIAEVYGEHAQPAQANGEDEPGRITGVPSNLSGERPDYFFGQDEVSALTGHSFDTMHRRSKSFDRIPAADSAHTEPQGDYQKPVQTPEPTVAASTPQGAPVPGVKLEPEKTTISQRYDAGPLPTPSNATHLRVQVQGPSVDPAGASPLQKSARGRITANPGFRDPVGESPMAWRKPGTSLSDPVGASPKVSADAGVGVEVEAPDDEADPSLDHLGQLMDDMDKVEEEKKEDDAHEVTLVVKTLKDDSAKDSTTPVKSATVPTPEASPVESKRPSYTRGRSIKERVRKDRKDRMASKATRAALKIAKTNSTEVLKSQLAEIPTPTNQDEPVGSAPVTAPEEESDAAAGSKVPGTPPPKPATKPKAELEVETDMEKSGFKSGSNTPSSDANAHKLTISAAAFTNAKAVAYLHKLQGEPSPRHSWHVGKGKKPAPSPSAFEKKLSKRRRKSKKGGGEPQSAGKKAPSPNDYGADSEEYKMMTISTTDNSEPAARVDATPKRSHLARKQPPSPEVFRARSGPVSSSKLFSSYHNKFQGRKPAKKRAPTPEGARASRRSPSPSGTRDFLPSYMRDRPLKPRGPLLPGEVASLAVRKGMWLRRIKRRDDIASGRSAPVVVTPKAPKPEGRNRFNFVPAIESEIKDPIQRAGRRLLSKAAVPIQTVARRFIAKREAVGRMRALITIQSFVRRWRCEANLQANIHSATIVQSLVRRLQAKERVKKMHTSAAQLQKIVRGYLVSVRVYETMYYLVRLQAILKGYCVRKTIAKQRVAAATVQRHFRGFIVRLHAKRYHSAVNIQRYIRGYMVNDRAKRWRSAVSLQSQYRGFAARKSLKEAKTSASLIQAAWRSYSDRLTYQFRIVDIIIVQSVVRRWSAHRRLQSLKNEKYAGAASKIQAICRGRAGRNLLAKHHAARKVQACWRGFQCYTDYIFALVDVLVVQRTVRQWLAKREAESRRREKATLVVQKHWRRHRAELTLLYTMVNVIIVQSVIRRHLNKAVVKSRKAEVAKARSEEQCKYDAAVAIQKSWRGFWGFSHYIITQYEITRLQAVIRGKLARQEFNLKLGCAIIMQATARMYLAKKRTRSKVMQDAIANAKAQELRERNASKRIQFWWRIVMDWMKEKKAALTIERFFIHVREEVDREITKQEFRKSLKKEKKKKKKRESEEKMLEGAWLDTVDENRTTASRGGKSTKSEKAHRSRSAPRLRANNSMPAATDSSHRNLPLGPNNNNKQVPGSSHSRKGGPPRGETGYRHSGRHMTTPPEPDMWGIHDAESSSSLMAPPPDAVRLAPSEDYSEVSNITNPSVFARTGNAPSGVAQQQAAMLRQEKSDEASLEEAYLDAEEKHSKDKRMTTEDYIKKYGGLKSAPNRMSTTSQQTTSRKPKHFFSEEGGKRVPSSPQVPTPRGTKGSSSSSKRHNNTPNSFSQGPSQSSTPRSSSKGTPRSHMTSPRLPVGKQYPPATPTGQKRGGGRRDDKHGSISRRETAETESATTHTTLPYARPSPRSGTSVMVMKKNYNSYEAPSFEEAQEVLYLGGEYGEVGEV